MRRAFCMVWVLAWVLTGCGMNYVTGKTSYNWFSLNSDIQLGSQVLGGQVSAFEKQKIPVDSEKNKVMHDRVQRIVSRISKVSHIPDFPYEVHVADAPIVNAWAAPGGKVMVYSGLWDPKKGLVNQANDDEIAAVLAHEIAHCTARHVTRALSRTYTAAIVGVAVTAVMQGAGYQNGADLFASVFQEGMNVFVPAYSRKSEAEADKIGLFYMAKAGYDPRAAVEVWKRAASKRGDQTSIYSTHPSNGERAKALEKYLPEALSIYSQSHPSQVTTKH